MALSNLVIKEVNRTNLYFNKFFYKLVINDVPNAYWLRRCKTLDEYIALIDLRYEEYNSTKGNYPRGWFREPIKSSDIDVVMISNLLDLFEEYNNKEEVKYRHEHTTFGVYTNDMSIVEKFASGLGVDTVYKVIPSPEGVKLFARKPPAKFRAYMTNNKMPNDFKQEFIEYIQRTPDVRPSDSFYTYLHRNHGYQSYLWDTYFIDYDDDKNLMMMMLMFPGAIGKKYKLEQK